jgi:hypothetical protein
MRALLFSLFNASTRNNKLNLSTFTGGVLFIAWILSGNLSIAQITSTGAGGEWSLPATWVGNVVPTLADDVIIAAGANVTVRSPYAINNPAIANSVTINGTLTMGGGSTDMRLQIAGALLINVGGTLTNNGNGNHVINVGGNFTNNGTFTPRVGTSPVGITQIIFDGAGPQVIDGTSATQTFEGITINKSADALTVAVGVTTINAASFTQTLGNFSAPPTFSVSGNVTLTAGTYNAGATTLIGGNYTRTGATSVFNASSGTVTFNGTAQTLNGTGGATPFYNVVVSSSLNAIYHINVLNNLSITTGATLTLRGNDIDVAGTTTVNGTIDLIESTAGTKTFTGLVTIATGGVWNNSINDNARFGSGITNNGTFTAGTGTYFFIGNGQLTGVFQIPNVTVDPTFTLTNNGTLTVSTALNGAGTFVQGASALLNLGGTEAVTTFTASGANNTVNYTGGDQNVRGNFVNLGLSGTGVKTLSTSTTSVTGTMTLSGTVSAITGVPTITVANLIIGAGCSVTNGNGINPRTLTITNSVSGAGSIIQTNNSILNVNGTSTLASIDAAVATNTVNYNGVTPTVIPGTYRNLVLNQSSGSATLSGNISVAGALTLSTGNLDLGNNNLTLESTASLSIATPSATRMIVTSGTGVVRKGFTATGPFTFPIGEVTGTAEYSPVTVNVTAGTFTGAYISASVVDAKSSSNNSTTNYLTRYWNISQTGISNGTFTVTGTYLGSDVEGAVASTAAAQLSGAFDQVTNGWKKYVALTGTTLTAAGASLADGVNSEFTGITLANPTVNIEGNDVAICPGTSVPLSTTVTNGIPTVVYAWSPATGLSAANVANPTATPTVTTIYSVTIYDGNGISATSNDRTITINPLPAEKTLSDPSTCIGTAGIITLTGSETGVNYQLRDGNTNVGAIVAGTGGDITFSVNPASSTNYNVLATVVATTCSLKMTDEAIVTVNPLPALPGVMNIAYCQNAAAVPLTATALANHTLQWYTTFTGGTASTTAPTPVTTTVGDTDYYVSQKNNTTGCESSRARITVTVNALPALPGVTNIAYCQNAAAVPLTATALADHNLQWYTTVTGGTASTTAPTPVTTTVGVSDYYVSQKNNTTGCESPRASIAVTINALPALPGVADLEYCQNTTATALTATALANHTLQWYTTSTGGTASTTAPTPVTTSPVSTTYYVSQKSDATGCESARASITVTVNALPTVSTPAATLHIGNVMTASPSTGGTWTSSDPAVATITDAGLITGISEGSVTFTFTVTATGCSSTTPLVTINDLPTVSIPSNKLCIGSTMSITPGTGGTWVSSDVSVATIDNAGLVTGLTAGSVTFTFTETSTGLSNTTPTVTVNDIPAVSLPSNTLCTGASMTLTPSSGGTWISSDNAVATIDNDGLVTGVTGGTVSFTFTETATGCSNTTLILTVNALPAVSAPVGVCVGGSITLSPATGGTWISSNNSIATVTNSGVVTGVSEGSVTFTFTSASTLCSNTTASVAVAPIPAKPTITTSNLSSATPTLTSSSDTGNQWFRNNTAIAGATNKTLTVTESGSYTVQVTSNGCAGPVSNAVDIVITGIEDQIISGQGRIYPNPANEVIQVDWSEFNDGVNIDVRIYDQVGRSITTKVMTTSDSQLDVRNLVGGSYIFLARQDKKLMIQRFIKE